MIKRVITNSGTANGTTHFVHDQWGNIIAELDATGATVREYIWLVEAEIAPTRGSRTTVDRPIAVVSNVNTTPALLMVHVDHLNRPIKMTDASKAVVWDAVWLPWGAPYQITGPEALDARFPGALFLVNTRRAGVERGSSTARMRVAGAGRHPKPRRNGIRSAV